MNYNAQLPYFSSYLQRALNVISEHDLRVPDEISLKQIIKAALEAQTLLFNAAVVKLESHRLNTFFEAFVLECAR